MTEKASPKTAGKRTITYDIEGHGEFVFTQPPRDVYVRLMKGVQDENIDSTAAMVAFIKTCLATPDGAAFERLLDDYPAFINEVGSELQDLAKPSAKAIVKKG